MQACRGAALRRPGRAGPAPHGARAGGQGTSHAVASQLGMGRGQTGGRPTAKPAGPQALMQIWVWGGFSPLRWGYFYKPSMLPRARLIYF